MDDLSFRLGDRCRYTASSTTTTEGHRVTAREDLNQMDFAANRSRLSSSLGSKRFAVHFACNISFGYVADFSSRLFLQMENRRRGWLMEIPGLQCSEGVSLDLFPRLS